MLTRSFRGWKFIEPEFNCIFTTPAEKIIIASDGFWADLSRQDQLALITESSEPIDPRDDISFLLFSNNLNEKNIPFLPKTPHPHSQTILRIR
jgi:serine/threonine protein phosphatase PrpC